MMHLSPNVFIAAIRERAVILDLARDRYVALNPGLAQAVLALTGLSGSQDPDVGRFDAAGAALVAKGFLTADVPELTPASGAWSALRPLHTQWPSGQPPAASRAGLRGFLSVQVSLAEAAWSLRTLTFQAVVERVARRKVRRGGPEISEQALLDAYFAARPWFPIKPICRLDAVALCLHLRRNGVDASLVFGVRLDPFKAHCWVQRGDRVLNEPHEIVARYAPIMLA